MGRKPNPLVVKHFNRGEKLNDSSNRYAHSCKSCGEQFPKGRADSLIGHLIRKCPKVTLDERRKAVLELNGLPDHGLGVPNQSAAGMNMGDTGTRVGSQPNSDAWTPLDALAAVSGAELHAQGSNSDPPGAPANNFRLKESFTLDNPPVSYEQRVQNNKKSDDQKATRSGVSEPLMTVDGNQLQRGQNHLQSPHQAPHGGDDLQFQLSNIGTYQNLDAPAQAGTFPSNMQHSDSASPNAVIATSMAQAAQAQFNSEMVDPQILEGDANINAAHFTEKAIEEHLQQYAEQNHPSMSDDFFNAGPGQQQASWVMNASREIHYPAPDASMIQSSEQGQGGHYPPLAMNSAGSPMTTEFSAEPGDGQRVNKPKSRARFNTTRRQEVQKVRKIGACLRCRMLKKPCSEETPCEKCSKVDCARIWKTPCTRLRLGEIFNMFSAGLHAVLGYDNVNEVKSQTTFDMTIEVEASHHAETGIFANFNAIKSSIQASNNIDPGLGNNPYAHVRLILDNNKDNIPKKIEAYVKRMQSDYIQREPSHFIQLTLTTAQQMAPNTSDKLLALTLEFWVTIHILVDHEVKWVLLEKNGPNSGVGPAITQDDGTYEIIRRQLSAGIEKRANDLSKMVLGMLERRLLSSSAQRSFELFLVGLLVMNCLEKSSWYFSSWQQAAFQATWPLPKPPYEYAKQSEPVAGLLDMLLRMKRVTAEPACSKDGILTCDREPAVQAFFAQAQLHEADIIRRRDHPQFNPLDSRCFEMRFCSGILLSEGK